MQFKPHTCLPPPSEKRLQRFEHFYRINLPLAYKEFLKTGHGGHPIQYLFDQGHRERVVEFFLVILDNPRHPERWRDVAVVLTDIDDRIVDNEDLLGNNIIPFAQLFAGDLVCFDFRKDPDHPDISVWDHELSEELKPHMEKVASSFEEFLGMLRGQREF